MNTRTGGLVPVNTGENLSPVYFRKVTGVKPMRLSVSAESLEETISLGGPLVLEPIELTVS